MAETIFDIRDASYAYLGRFPALNKINLTVPRGEKLVLMGANGTGKSTLLLLLDGLIFPATGSVKAFGMDLTEEALADPASNESFRKRVGLVFQNADVQLFCPTVKDDILFGPLNLGVPKDQALCRLDGLSRTLGIGELLERSPYQLSVGEKRKVAIASTLAVDPDVLLLDEPTAGLDPATTRQIVDILLEASGRGKTIITATHDIHIVEEIADVVCVMNRDKTIAACCEPQALMRDRAFLQEHNLIHIHRHRHKEATHVHPHEHTDHHH